MRYTSAPDEGPVCVHVVVHTNSLVLALVRHPPIHIPAVKNTLKVALKKFGDVN
jgi:hypothetical protein